MQDSRNFGERLELRFLATPFALDKNDCGVDIVRLVCGYAPDFESKPKDTNLESALFLGKAAGE